MGGGAGGLDGRYHIARMDDARILLPTGIDVRHEHGVCAGKAGDPLGEQRSRARIAVALKHAVEMLVRQARGGFQRGADLIRMVSIVMKHANAVALSIEFKPAARVAERGDGGTIEIEGDADPVGHGERTERVQNIVRAGNAELHAAERFIAAHGGKGRVALRVISDVGGAVITAGQPVGQRAVRALFDQRAYKRIVRTADERAVGGQPVQKFFKSTDDVLHGLEVVQMIVIDVADERNGRGKRQKALHVFAGLRDEQVAAADPNAAAERIHIAADVDGRIRVRRLSDAGEHGGDGSFAMTAGDGDNLMESGGDLAQRHAALKLRNAPLRCNDALRVIRLDRGGVDHKIRAVKICARVADRIGNARRVQTVCKLRALPVAAGDHMPVRFQNARKTAHAAAADADQMNMVRAFQAFHEKAPVPKKFSIYYTPCAGDAQPQPSGAGGK